MINFAVSELRFGVQLRTNTVLMLKFINQKNMSLPKPNKKPLNKITSFLLVVFLLVQIVGGILVPIEISMNPLRITSNQASAAWYDSSWTKRKAITVTEKSDSALTNYQLEIIFTYYSDMNSGLKFQRLPRVQIKLFICIMGMIM